MVDVVYKRSFYDKICRGVVGIGMLYLYTKGVTAIDDFMENKKSDYSIINIRGNDMLMYKPNNNFIEINQDWFNQNLNNNLDDELNDDNRLDNISIDSIIQ